MTINNVTQLEAKLESIISEPINKIGYKILRIQLIENQRKTLQIIIERVDDKDIIMRDCEKVSKLVSVLLDVEDPISGKYNLEISSPGIDRPLIYTPHLYKSQLWGVAENEKNIEFVSNDYTP